MHVVVASYGKDAGSEVGCQRYMVDFCCHGSLPHSPKNKLSGCWAANLRHAGFFYTAGLFFARVAGGAQNDDGSNKDEFHVFRDVHDISLN